MSENLPLRCRQDPAWAAREIERLRRDCFEFYQVIGCLSNACDKFEDDQVIKALNNASAAAVGTSRVHEDLLPFWHHQVSGGATDTVSDQPRTVWMEGGHIITRNADGGTTSWSEIDAVLLHKRLGTILEGYGLIVRGDIIQK